MKKKFLFLCLLGFELSATGQKQGFGDLNINGITQQKLDDTRAQMDAWYQQNSKGKGSGWKHYQRWLEQMRYRVDPDGTISNHALRNWQALKQQGITNTASPLRIGGNWYPLSMGTVTTGKSGRINCIAFHPSDPNIIFAGYFIRLIPISFLQDLQREDCGNRLTMEVSGPAFLSGSAFLESAALPFIRAMQISSTY